MGKGGGREKKKVRMVIGRGAQRKKGNKGYIIK
jgi:hypothetical protein